MKPNPYEDANGNLILGPAWASPPSLTLATLEALKYIPRLWLADAINLMAFGKRADLTELGNFRRCSDPSIKRDGTPNFANIAQHMRAAKALFSAAHTGKIEFLTSPTKSGDVSDPLPGHYFDYPRMLGSEDNSIATDLHEAAKNDDHEFYRAARDRNHLTGVRVKTASFVAWLNGVLGVAGDGPARNAEAKRAAAKRGCPPEYEWHGVETEAMRLMDKNGDFTPSNPKWNSPATLKEALLKYCSERHGKEPGDSTMREKVKTWVDKWQRSQQMRGQ
jgi:hypothetical protein